MDPEDHADVVDEVHAAREQDHPAPAIVGTGNDGDSEHATPHTSRLMFMCGRRHGTARAGAALWGRRQGGAMCGEVDDDSDPVRH